MTPWILGDPLSVDILYVRPEQRDDIRLELDGLATPPRVIEIAPLAADHLTLVHALVKLHPIQQAATTVPFDGSSMYQSIEGIDPSVQSLLVECATLINALQRFDVETAQHQCQRIRALAQGAPILTPRSNSWLLKTLAFLEHFLRRCLAEFVLPGLYMHADTANRKRWWRSLPTLEQTCADTLQRFDSTLNGGPPASLLRLREWVKDVQQQLTQLHLTLGQSEATVFRLASAFFAARSECFSSRGHWVLSLITLHRSAEWLLASHCAERNLLDFSTFETRMRSGEQMTFSMLLQSCASSGVNMHGMTDALEQLNTWRNLFPYTHHMSIPDEAIATKLHSDLSTQNLRRLAKNDWELAVRAYRRPVPLDLRSLLDPDESLQSSYKELTAAELAL